MSAAMQLNTNIKERLKILGNLHWRLLHALNAAEEVFRDKELPEMEEQAKSMRKQIKVCSSPHQTWMRTGWFPGVYSNHC